MFYLLCINTQWRMLPHKYPPRPAGFYHYAQWLQDDTWEHVTQAVRESYRCMISRAQQPTAAIIDGYQSRPLRWVNHAAMMAPRT